MKNYKIKISNEAKIDLYSIFEYISNQLFEPKIALKTIRKIKNEIFSLSTMPERFSLVTDERLEKLGIRKVIADNYIVFYFIDKKTKLVFIIRVLYGKRDWLSLL